MKCNDEEYIRCLYPIFFLPFLIWCPTPFVHLVFILQNSRSLTHFKSPLYSQDSGSIFISNVPYVVQMARLRAPRAISALHRGISDCVRSPGYALVISRASGRPGGSGKITACSRHLPAQRSCQGEVCVNRPSVRSMEKDPNDYFIWVEDQDTVFIGLIYGKWTLEPAVFDPFKALRPLSSFVSEANGTVYLLSQALNFLCKLM